MSLPISAQRAAYGVLTDGEKLFEDRGVNLLKIAVKNTTSDYQIGVYAYKAEHWLEDKSNLDTKYYEVEPTGYIFRNFTVAEADTLTLDFYAVEANLLIRTSVIVCIIRKTDVGIIGIWWEI